MRGKFSLDKDTVIRGTARDGRVLILACLTTNLVAELQRRHDTWPVVTAALGRTASITAMMAMMLKNEERITVKIDGDGPIGQIWVEATPDGDVRGYADNPHVDLPLNAVGKLDVGGGVGQGQLYVIRDTGLRDFYTGSSELQTGEIADDFTYYFVASEQIPSAVGAGVLVGTDLKPIVSGGFLIQLLPGHDEADISYIEEQLKGVPSVTNFLQETPSAEALLRKLCPDAHIHGIQDVRFQCTCSYDRLERVLISLGHDELVTLRDEDGHAELTCHFCGNVYQFSRADLDRMIQHIEESQSANREGE